MSDWEATVDWPVPRWADVRCERCGHTFAAHGGQFIGGSCWGRCEVTATPVGRDGPKVVGEESCRCSQFIGPVPPSWLDHPTGASS